MSGQHLAYCIIFKFFLWAFLINQNLEIMVKMSNPFGQKRRLFGTDVLSIVVHDPSNCREI